MATVPAGDLAVGTQRGHSPPHIPGQDTPEGVRCPQDQMSEPGTEPGPWPGQRRRLLVDTSHVEASRKPVPLRGPGPGYEAEQLSGTCGTTASPIPTQDQPADLAANQWGGLPRPQGPRPLACAGSGLTQEIAEPRLVPTARATLSPCAGHVPAHGQQPPPRAELAPSSCLRDTSTCGRCGSRFPSTRPAPRTLSRQVLPLRARGTQDRAHGESAVSPPPPCQAPGTAELGGGLLPAVKARGPPSS